MTAGPLHAHEGHAPKRRTKQGTPRRKPSARWPCIFRGTFVREQVDPRVKELWERTTGKHAPFGRLRLAFQTEHCQSINPYGSESCPYREEECAMAFLSVVQNSLLPWIDDPAAYFVTVARSTGIDRADHKPLAREMHRGPQGPGDAGDLRLRDLEGREGGEGLSGLRVEPDLRRSSHRPESVGSLLGSFDLGSRQRPTPDGAEGTER